MPPGSTSAFGGRVPAAGEAPGGKSQRSVATGKGVLGGELQELNGWEGGRAERGRRYATRPIHTSYSWNLPRLRRFLTWLCSGL